MRWIPLTLVISCVVIPSLPYKSSKPVKDERLEMEDPCWLVGQQLWAFEEDGPFWEVGQVSRSLHNGNLGLLMLGRMILE